MTLPRQHQVLQPVSRRDFLWRAGAGFGGLAFSALQAWNAQAAPAAAANMLAPKPPHIKARARRVIWCFMDGGPSHLDLFDPKPELTKLDGKPLPASFKRPVTAMGVTAHAPLLASRRIFKQHGQAGHWVSDWYPEIAGCADDLAIVRSCRADGLTHVASVLQMNTGSLLQGRPSLGAWSIYGLGSESDRLPGFVVLADSSNDPPGGTPNWGTGFMPAAYQGTRFAEGSSPILFTDAPEGMSGARQRAKLDFIQALNRRYNAEQQAGDAISAQINAYELAFRMQSAAPEVVDLSKETEETKKLYGLDQPETEKNGRNCLLARRLIERGVRFVQIYMGAGTRWDAHSDLEGNHGKYCKESDRPIAGLLKDLKRRGLLQDTLVVWGGEFGRTPMSESGNGRDHNPYGFTMWLAGGGVKPGYSYGTTDDLGLYAVDKPAHVHDIHATILHLLGLDHKQLTFPHDGRDERATVNGGRILHDLVAG
ncbi:MAG: DUF1501 domain-containing protein [Planctomycetia bacterium]|nr:DUF1501 domain-containing protein [Planctomycetia bacterium]